MFPSRELGPWLHPFIAPRCHGANLPTIPKAAPQFAPLEDGGWFGYVGILGNFFAWVKQLCRFILLLCSNVLRVTSPELFHQLSGDTSEMLISTVPVAYSW